MHMVPAHRPFYSGLVLFHCIVNHVSKNPNSVADYLVDRRKSDNCVRVARTGLTAVLDVFEQL